ncbi:XdhC family protein, partial [Streptomyces sp. NPDC059233]
VYDLCLQALEDGETVLERFGYSDDDAFAVGLTCGGIIDILVTPVRVGSPARAVFASALEAASRGEAAAVARVAEGPAGLMGGAVLVRADGSYEGTLAALPQPDAALGGHPELDRAVADEARAMLDAGATGVLEIGADGRLCGEPLKVLVESSVAPPRMIVFGAIDFASALVRIGKFLGYRVTVCDARPVFATRTRFPEADEIVVDWPHGYLEAQTADGDLDGRTVLCVLTHDAKFDVPLLETALRLPVAYVGAMGSRRTHEDRNRRLREAGVTELELARLRSPIGLDLGGRTPEETALSIAAEIVANRRGGSGVSLAGAHTPIHPDPSKKANGRIGSVA